MDWKLGNSPEAKERVYDTYFYAKAAPWCYEKEWRHLQEKSGAIASGFLPTAVYFGLRCDQAVVHAVARRVVSDDVPPYEIYPSGDSFALESRQADTAEYAARGLRRPAISRVQR
jgi:hypothetical protein